MPNDKKITEMKVGQVWRSNDKREGYVTKRVVGVGAGWACLENARGRKTTVSQEKFLKRQGTRSGYSLVEE